MRGAVFLRFLSETRRALLGWGLTMIGICLLYLPLYPSMGGSQLDEVYAQMPSALREAMGVTGPLDGVGYANSTVYAFIGTVLLAIAALAWGTRAIAGDEESGGLELTLAHAVGRSRLVLQRALAIAIQMVVLAVVLGLSVALLSAPSNLGIRTGNVVAAGVAQLGLVLLVGMCALAAGALSGRRAVATAVGAAVLVLAKAFETLGAQVTSVAWLKSASPFQWAFGADPLRNGFDLGGVALLYGSCALLVLLAIVGLARRDVGVG